MNLVTEDIDALEEWWVQKSRVNFLAYRQFMRYGDFEHNWFIANMCGHLQQFFIDLKAGKRPVLFIQSPPQHGKSWAITDFIAWISGVWPELRTIYSSYSEKLSMRCNMAQQRAITSDKYRKIFPGTGLAHKKGDAVRTATHLEFVDKDGNPTDGQFRNTTVAGPVTGESLDLGIIDDAVKGREQANSLPLSEKIWGWFLDDFSTRFSDQAGLIIIMTRWTTHDIIGRLRKKYKEIQRPFKVVNYKAIASKDGRFRKEGEALFPKLKSLAFLKEKKVLMLPESWESLYQGNPTKAGGNLIKDTWWKWWEVLPKMEFNFAVADTAQKVKNVNDWTVFKHWGFGVDGNIYLLDMFRERVTAPDLRRKAEIFYLKCTKREKVGNFRGMCIEDKSSGIGLIQEFEEKNYKVHAIPRSIDKVTRAYDTGPEIKAGKVFLNTLIPGVDIITNEAREFPNGEYDDAWDCTMSAIEVAYLYPDILNFKIFIA